MKIKNLVLILVLTYTTLIGYTQTAIGPMIGYDIAEIIIGEYPTPNWPQVTEGFNRNSFLFGLKFKQNFSKKYYFSVVTAYTQKEFSDRLGSPLLEFNAIFNELSIHRQLYKGIDFGVGGVYNYLYGFGLDYLNHGPTENHLGYVISASYNFQNFIFDFRFKALSIVSKDKYVFVDSFRSFDLSVSYMFDVLSKKE